MAGVSRRPVEDVDEGAGARLSPDIIKIDRSLVHEVTLDEAQRTIAIALAELGRRVGTALVAEGVEDQPTLDVLREAGITHARGWLFDRPCSLPIRRTSYA